MNRKLHLKALAALVALALCLPAAVAAQDTGDRIAATGTLSIEGECQILTTARGEQFALVGDLQGAMAGDRLRVRGTVGERTICLPATTILVDRVKVSRSQGRGESNRAIAVTGMLTDEGVECQALRGEDGVLYTLTGNLGDFETGDRVRVVGKVAQVSICQQGTTLVVKNIKPAKDGNK